MIRQLISRWGIMSIELQTAIERDMAVIEENENYEYVDNEEPIVPITPATEKPVQQQASATKAEKALTMEDIKDDDMMAAALVATIDYHEETGENVRVVSIKEIKYKLFAKGLNSDIIDEYISNHNDELNDYEIQSIKNIFYKKQISKDEEDIKQMLLKKGYKLENIKEALSEVE